MLISIIVFIGIITQEMAQVSYQNMKLKNSVSGASLLTFLRTSAPKMKKKVFFSSAAHPHESPC